MHLYEIVDKLRRSRRGVFSLADICRHARVGKEEASVYLHRMLEKNFVYKIQKGKFAVEKDPFIASTQLVFPSYISFVTALYLHGKFQQVVDRILVVTPHKKSPMRFLDTEVRFVRLKPELIFGFKKVRKGRSYILLAELEKAMVDILHLPRYGRISYVADLIEDADVQKLARYAELMGEAVVRRTGFLFDEGGIEHSLKPRTKTVYKLNPSIKAIGEFNPKWSLYVNEVR